MRVTMITTMAGPRGATVAGQEVELDRKTARTLIAHGFARPLTPPVSAWRTQWRSVSAVHPIFSATDRIAAHCDSCWCSWSNTNRNRPFPDLR